MLWRPGIAAAISKHAFPSEAPTRQPSLQSLSIQEEGNACFDMAAAIPGLQSISGNHLVSISKRIACFIYCFNHCMITSFFNAFIDRWIIYVTVMIR